MSRVLWKYLDLWFFHTKFRSDFSRNKMHNWSTLISYWLKSYFLVQKSDLGSISREKRKIRQKLFISRLLSKDMNLMILFSWMMHRLKTRSTILRPSDGWIVSQTTNLKLSVSASTKRNVASATEIPDFFFAFFLPGYIFCNKVFIFQKSNKITFRNGTHINSSDTNEFEFYNGKN